VERVVIRISQVEELHDPSVPDLRELGVWAEDKRVDLEIDIPPQRAAVAFIEFDT
jgi:hypothetical protein